MAGVALSAATPGPSRPAYSYAFTSIEIDWTSDSVSEPSQLKISFTRVAMVLLFYWVLYMDPHLITLMKATWSCLFIAIGTLRQQCSFCFYFGNNLSSTDIDSSSKTWFNSLLKNYLDLVSLFAWETFFFPPERIFIIILSPEVFT